MEWNQGATYGVDCIDTYGQTEECTERPVCETFDCSSSAASTCELVECFYPCTNGTTCDASWITSTFEAMDDTCDGYYAWFETNGGDPPCGEECYDPFDCSGDFAFLNICLNNVCVNTCDDTQTCMVEFAETANDMVFVKTCEEFDQYLSDKVATDDTCVMTCAMPNDCMEATWN